MMIRPVKQLVSVTALAGLLLTSALSLDPPCTGGTYMGVFLLRSCRDVSPRCSVLLPNQTVDKYCGLWCCPTGGQYQFDPAQCGPEEDNGCSFTENENIIQSPPECPGT